MTHDGATCMFLHNSPTQPTIDRRLVETGHTRNKTKENQQKVKPGPSPNGTRGPTRPDTPQVSHITNQSAKAEGKLATINTALIMSLIITETFLWLLTHDILPTNSYLGRTSLDMYPTCHYYSSHRRNSATHILPMPKYCKLLE